jgi:hypothetical protein
MRHSIEGDAVADLENIRHTAETTPAAELPDLIGALAAAQAVATRRLIAPTTPTATEASDPLVDAATMAAQLGIKASWLLDQARRSRVPHVRLGKYVRFRPADVLAAAKAQDCKDCDAL